jgi:pimeloyl-ACP methyl ester carboxylesterase
VFCVVTADGAIVQEHALKGLDGLAPVGTFQPLLHRSWCHSNRPVEPRLGVIMNSYVEKPGVALQLFVSDPFHDSIAVIDLTIVGLADSEVFAAGDICRIHSYPLSSPVNWGDSDRRIPPAHGDAFREGIAGAELIVPAAGHMVIAEQPEGRLWQRSRPSIEISRLGARHASPRERGEVISRIFEPAFYFAGNTADACRVDGSVDA